MKNFVGTGKIWTLLSALIFIMTFGLVVYAATTSGSRNFLDWQSGKINNTLSASDWDNLMASLNEYTVPKGAIVAFDDKNTCPTGWTLVTGAQNRFLMGSGQVKKTGGTASVKLEINNIPAHSHYYKDSIFSESIGHQLVEGENSSRNQFLYGTTRYNSHNNETNGLLFTGDGDRRFGNEHRFLGTSKNDHDNIPVFGFRKTSNSVCTDGMGQIRGGYTDYKNTGNLLFLSEVMNNCQGDNTSFSVQNPYYTVIYCRKN